MLRATLNNSGRLCGRSLCVLQLLSALAVSAGAAQEGNDVVIELGGGGNVRPAYEGADEYVFQPIPIVDLRYLRLPVLGEVRRGPKEGFSVGPAVRHVAERQEDDSESLEGLDDVSAAVEFGATLSYRRDWFRGFVTLRRGVGGHEGFVGDAGLDVLVRPWATAEVSFGPRLSFADNDYTDT